MTIELTTDDIDTIESFIDQMWQAGKSSKGGSGFEKFSQMYQKGKGSEVAVRRFLEQGGVNCSVDFEVYEGSDSTDLKPLNVEIKQAPHYASWVAIPETKFDQIPEGQPIIQVKTHDSDEFEVCGWAYQEDLFRIEEGEKPFTQFEDNMCLPIDDLRTDWSEFVDVASDGTQSYQRFTFST